MVDANKFKVNSRQYVGLHLYFRYLHRFGTEEKDSFSMPPCLGTDYICSRVGGRYSKVGQQPAKTREIMRKEPEEGNSRFVGIGGTSLPFKLKEARNPMSLFGWCPWCPSSLIQSSVSEAILLLCRHSTIHFHLSLCFSSLQKLFPT